MPAPADAPALGGLLYLADRLLGRSPDLCQRRRSRRQFQSGLLGAGLHLMPRQLIERQRSLAGPDQRTGRQRSLHPGPRVSVQPLGLVQHQQAGLAQRRLLTGGQGFAAGQRLGIQHQHAGLQRQHPLPGRRSQLLQQLGGMAKAGGLDQQPVRARLTQQPRESDLKGRAIDAAQAASGNLGQTDAIRAGRQQCRIQTDLAELVDQHRPALTRRLVRQEVADQAGLACAQRAGNQVGGNMTEHGFSRTAQSAD